MCKIRIISAEKSICKEVANRQVIIYLPTDSLSLSIIPGDYLLFFGKLEESSLYLKRQSFASSGFIRQEDWVLEQKSNRHFSIFLKALSIRRILLNHLKQIVSENQSYAIAAALMFGVKDRIKSRLSSIVC